jgi:hypothetical protein
VILQYGDISAYLDSRLIVGFTIDLLYEPSMKKLSELTHFQEQQNIVLQGYDPISAGGFT